MAKTTPRTGSPIMGARKQIQQGARATDVAESLLHDIKSAAMVELSKQKAQALQKLIYREEEKINTAVAKLFEQQNTEKANRLTFYYEELTQYYYTSTTRSATEIQKYLISELNNLRHSITNDTLLGEDEKRPLLEILTKTVDTFERRTAIHTRLVEKSKQILGRAFRVGATHSGLGSLALFAVDKYQDYTENKLQEQEDAIKRQRDTRIRRQQKTSNRPAYPAQSQPQQTEPTSSPGPKNTDASSVPFGEGIGGSDSRPQIREASSTPSANRITLPTATEVEEAPTPSVKAVRVSAYTKKDGTEVKAHTRALPYTAQLVRTLGHHTVLLSGIHQTSNDIRDIVSKQLTLHEQQLNVAELRAEEETFESRSTNDGKEQITTIADTAKKVKEESGGMFSGMMGDLAKGGVTSLLSRWLIPALSSSTIISGLLGIATPLVVGMMGGAVGLAIGTWIRNQYNTDKLFDTLGQKMGVGGERIPATRERERFMGEWETPEAEQRGKATQTHMRGVVVSKMGTPYKNEQGLYEFEATRAGDNAILKYLTLQNKEGVHYQSAVAALNIQSPHHQQLKKRAIEQGLMPNDQPNPTPSREAGVSELSTTMDALDAAAAASDTIPTTPPTPLVDVAQQARTAWRVPEAQQRMEQSSTPPSPSVGASASKLPGSQQPSTMSERGIQMLTGLEGFSAEAYRVNEKDKWTIGHGLTMWDGQPVSPTHPGRTITIEESVAQKRKMLSQFEQGVASGLRVPITQDQFDALVSVAYNKGEARDLIAKLNRGQNLTYEDFAASATQNRVRGKDLPKPLYGLELRRALEYARFSGQTELENITQMGGSGQQRYAQFMGAMSRGVSTRPGSAALTADTTLAGREETTNNLRTPAAPTVQPPPVILNNNYVDNRAVAMGSRTSATLDTRNTDTTLSRVLFQ